MKRANLFKLRIAITFWIVYAGILNRVRMQRAIFSTRRSLILHIDVVTCFFFIGIYDILKCLDGCCFFSLSFVCVFRCFSIWQCFKLCFYDIPFLVTFIRKWLFANDPVVICRLLKQFSFIFHSNSMCILIHGKSWVRSVKCHWNSLWCRWIEVEWTIIQQGIDYRIYDMPLWAKNSIICDPISRCMKKIVMLLWNNAAQPSFIISIIPNSVGSKPITFCILFARKPDSTPPIPIITYNIIGENWRNNWLRFFYLRQITLISCFYFGSASAAAKPKNQRKKNYDERGKNTFFFRKKKKKKMLLAIE